MAIVELADLVETETLKIYYFGDPMCLWCYGSHLHIKGALNSLSVEGHDYNLNHVIGVLAPQSKDGITTGPELMPYHRNPGQFEYIQLQWKENYQGRVPKENQRPLNFEVWNRPDMRRSTYESCEAVVLMGGQSINGKIDLYWEMFEAIQLEFYQHAQNTSNRRALLRIARTLADDLGSQVNIDLGRFEAELYDGTAQEQLVKNQKLNRALAHLVHQQLIGREPGSPLSFPSLVVSKGSNFSLVAEGSR